MAATVVTGHLYGAGRIPFRTHFAVALAGAVTLLFTHSMVMFYFIGTGKKVKEAVRDRKWNPEIYQRTVVFKRRVFPLTFWTILVVMATFILGGGTDTGLTPTWLHRLLAWSSLVLQCLAFPKQVVSLGENGAFMARLSEAVEREDSRLRRAAATS